MDKLAYLQFLRSKLPTAEQCGAEPPSPCHPSLKPHQVEICEWAMRGGRRAVFAQFGLGKTRMHLQIAAWVVEWTRGEFWPDKLPPIRQKFLIVAPLGVRQEFTQNDGPAMGLRVEYIRTMAEAEASTALILITNYERVRDGDIDPKAFAGAGLDESSVLRSFGSKTYQTFLDKFAGLRFRFVFTATPSPNRYKELIHYAGFLGVMDTGEALTRFFQRDSSEAGNLTLYPHMEGQFWHWLMSWAVFLQSPADLGHDATGYDLPPMRVHWHRVEVDHTANWTAAGDHFDGWGQGQMFIDQSQGLATAAKVKRDSVALRVEKAKEIMAAATRTCFLCNGDGWYWENVSDEEGIRVDCRDCCQRKRHWLLWHDLEAERREIEKEIPAATTVYGTQDLEAREAAIMGFSRGEFPILATKPVIAGSGCNFQRHCSDAIFLGVGYKFNDFIQACHRIYRFQQAHEVNIHIIYLDTEDLIKAELEAKWRRHNELVERMTELLREHRLQSNVTALLQRTLGVEREERRAA